MALQWSKRRATCPACWGKSPVVKNQKGIIVSPEDEIVIETAQYSQSIQEALSTGLKTGGRNYQRSIAKAFPTTGGGSS